MPLVEILKKGMLPDAEVYLFTCEDWISGLAMLRLRCFYYRIANVISASQASSPFTVATAFPFPIGPFMRMISTSRRS